MEQLAVDPVPELLASDNRAVLELTRRDLLGERAPARGVLCELPEVHRIVGRQRDDGRWSYPNPKPGIRSVDDYDQLETYRQLAILVHKYELTAGHPAIERARQFLSSFQTGNGDYRGIYGYQYTPNYSAAITELLIRAGYQDTAQVERTMRWLCAIRQDDGRWAIPTRTLGLSLDAMLATRETLEPDRSRPSSHLITGIVLRAFAAHSRYRREAFVQDAGRWLASRFFTRDFYVDRSAPSYWFVFSYPFWWTDLLSSLDALTTIGLTSADADIARGVGWFIHNQERSGLWSRGRNRPKGRDSDDWVGLAIARMLAHQPALAGHRDG